MDTLEEAINSNVNTKSDIEEIGVKLKNLEATINSAIAELANERQKTSPRHIYPQMQAFLRELETLKKNNAELAQNQAELNEANLKQKKTIWSRFSIS
jgi:hypothetical protein